MSNNVIVNQTVVSRLLLTIVSNDVTLNHTRLLYLFLVIILVEETQDKYGVYGTEELYNNTATKLQQ